MKNTLLKIFFGLMIFLFCTALAYYTASYLQKEQGADYWLTLAIFSLVYIVVGMGAYSVFPVSLGMLFGADVLLLHLLSTSYSDFPNTGKALILGIVLLILYIFAFYRFKDMPENINHQTNLMSSGSQT